MKNAHLLRRLVELNAKLETVCLDRRWDPSARKWVQVEKPGIGGQLLKGGLMAAGALSLASTAARTGAVLRKGLFYSGSLRSHLGRSIEADRIADRVAYAIPRKYSGAKPGFWR